MPRKKQYTIKDLTSWSFRGKNSKETNLAHNVDQIMTERLDRLTGKLRDIILVKFRSKKIPSVREQLKDL